MEWYRIRLRISDEQHHGFIRTLFHNLYAVRLFGPGGGLLTGFILHFFVADELHLSAMW